MTQTPGRTRMLALAGPPGSGKTSLMEALLAASGEMERRPGGSLGIGDASPEAKARGYSVELNFARFKFMGDDYAVVDCPGAVELEAEGAAALAAADMVLIVTEPDPGKAGLLQPLFHKLEDLKVPHALFINKMDLAKGALDELLQALTPIARTPLVARQLPIFTGEKVTGYVDLALERVHVYRPNQESELVPLEGDVAALEADARFHMLEQIADYDDELMEQLLSDINPTRDLVFADLVREAREGLITPVFFGSASNGFGVRRLLKAIRHDTAGPEAAAARLGIGGVGAAVIKVNHAGQSGKLAYARVLGGGLADGAELNTASGTARVGGLSFAQGPNLIKAAKAGEGDVVALGKVEEAGAGQILGVGAQKASTFGIAPPAGAYGLAVAAANRKDDVRLSGALSKLLEEDPGLSVHHDTEAHQVQIFGQGDTHLRLTLDRLKRKHGVDVTTEAPVTAYRESIRGKTHQHARHKKQSGGHGQFADVKVDIAPRERGAGFAFVNKITGGVVPKQWIPAVEHGVVEGLKKGPLGFPVVDVEVALVDGQFHPVDSSEMAFQIAGRLAVDEGLPKCGPYLLEPIDKLIVYTPTSAISGVNSMISSRRGQILGFGPRPGWNGWDAVEAYLPHSEVRDLVAELRSLTQGLGSFEAEFDHMAELAGRPAEEAIAAAKARAA
jgi:elongation factor G